MVVGQTESPLFQAVVARREGETSSPKGNKATRRPDWKKGGK